MNFVSKVWIRIINDASITRKTGDKETNDIFTWLKLKDHNTKYQDQFYFDSLVKIYRFRKNDRFFIILEEFSFKYPLSIKMN